MSVQAQPSSAAVKRLLRRSPLSRAAVASLLWLVLVAPDAPAVAQDPDANEPPRIENPIDTTPPGVRAEPAAPAPMGTLVLDVDGFRNDHGQALIAIFRNSAGFPKRVSVAYWKTALAIDRRHLNVTLTNVPSGILAVMVIHDENRDFALGTGRFGFRTEGYGTSRDAQSLLGSPDFYDAAVSLKPGERLYLRVPLHY